MPDRDWRSHLAAARRRLIGVPWIAGFLAVLGVLYWWGFLSTPEVHHEQKHAEAHCQYPSAPKQNANGVPQGPLVVVCFNDGAAAGSHEADNEDRQPPRAIVPLSQLISRRIVSDPIALFTIVLSLFTWRLIVVGRYQHAAAVDGLAETAKAANAAVLSAEAVVGVEIPTVRVRQIKLRDSVHNLCVRLTYPRFHVVVRNYGRSPAFLDGEAICVGSALPAIPDYSDGAVDLPPSYVIEGGDDYTLEAASQHSAFGTDEVDDFLNGRRILYVYGYVRYEDFMRERHILRFIYEFIPKKDGSYTMLALERPGYSDSL